MLAALVLILREFQTTTIIYAVFCIYSMLLVELHFQQVHALIKEAVAEAQAPAAELVCKVYHSLRIIYFIGLKLCNKINKLLFKN